MKPIFQKLTAEPEEGFAFKTLRAKGFDCPWHVHPEYELILVLQSDGYRMVGDNIAGFGVLPEACPATNEFGPAQRGR
jgi:hypothetical protein